MIIGIWVHTISEGSDQITDVQSQSMQADPSLRTTFIVGFAMHRHIRDLFVQTLTLVLAPWVQFSADDILNFFFSFFQENRICISCNLPPLHEMSNPVFLVMKKKIKKK